MNKFFRLFSLIITVLSVILLTVPFLFVINEGLQSFLSFPYPKEIMYALKLSMKSSIFSSILCMIFALVIVWNVSKLNSKMKVILDYIFSFPLGLPHIISGIALISFFGAKNFGKFLSPFGIDFVYTTSGVVLAQFFVNLPYTIKTFSALFETIDENLIFAGRNLGLTDFEVFLHIVLPLLKNQILCIWLICFSRALGEFGACMMLVGVTRMKTETLATSIFLNMTTGEFDVASGICIMLMSISLIVMIISNLIFKRDKNVKNR